MQEQIIAVLSRLHDEIVTDAVLRDALQHAARKNGRLVVASGNAGDGLIHAGASALLQHHGLALPLCDEHALPHLPAGSVAVVVGGAMIEGIWDERVRHLRMHLERGGEVILLACTLFGFEPVLRRHAGQITAFLRDRPSCENARACGVTAHLTHDLAFAIPTDFYRAHWHRGDQPLTAFRTDAERARQDIPFGNVDLSLLWNGNIWTDPALTLQRCEMLAGLMSGYDRIETDRLHLSILGAALGLSVTLHATARGKTAAVYEHTLARFPNIRFVPEEPATGEWAHRDQLFESAQELARLRRDWYEPELERRAAEIQRLKIALDESRAEEVRSQRLFLESTQEITRLRQEWYEPELERRAAEIQRLKAALDESRTEEARLQHRFLDSAQELAQLHRDRGDPESERQAAEIQRLKDALDESRTEEARLQHRLLQVAKETRETHAPKIETAYGRAPKSSAMRSLKLASYALFPYNKRRRQRRRMMADAIWPFR